MIVIKLQLENWYLNWLQSKSNLKLIMITNWFRTKEDEEEEIDVYREMFIITSKSMDKSFNNIFKLFVFFFIIENIDVLQTK